jgi:Protein of unknown function (DUF4043)
MAEVVLATALQKQTWSNEITTEYVRESGLMSYMGTEDTSIIRIRMEHKDESGDTVNFPLIQRIKGRGVRGSEVLKGNEADLGLANTKVVVDWIRHGVKLPKSTTFRTAIDMWGASKPQLRSWSAELLRDDTLAAMNSVIVPGTVDAQGLPGTDSQVSYQLASAAQRNTFLAQNSDRVVFGNARANISSGNFATSLGNVTIATGLSSAAHIRLLKQIAKAAGQVAPAASTTGFTTNIKPYKSDMTAGREWFVYFVGMREFSALSLDASIVAANTNSRAREGDGIDRNPLFQDGDLIFQGVIIREVPEIDNLILIGAGGGGADVSPGFFCGQSAIAVGYGMRPAIVEDFTEDYNFRPGMAIEELRGVAKTSFGGMQYGIVTSMVAVSALA